MRGNLICMNISHKICTRCNLNMSLSNFTKNINMKDGLLNQCKACRFKSRKPQKTNTEANRLWFQRNKEKVKSERRKRYANDMDFRLSCNLRNRLGKMMRGRIKNGSAIKDLGCSVEEFRAYLEKLFKPGMNWNNYGFGEGKWNIDHIIPLSSFNLKDRAQFLKACHYSNLQPLWHIENIRKSDIVK